MTRDLDLLRDILLTAAAQAPGVPLRAAAPEFDFDTVTAHVEILLEASYVKGAVYRGDAGACLGWDIDRVTLSGYAYLDSVRDPAVHRETRYRLAGSSATVGLDTVAATAQAFAAWILAIG